MVFLQEQTMAGLTSVLSRVLKSFQKTEDFPTSFYRGWLSLIGTGEDIESAEHIM